MILFRHSHLGTQICFSPNFVLVSNHIHLHGFAYPQYSDSPVAVMINLSSFAKDLQKAALSFWFGVSGKESKQMTRPVDARGGDSENTNRKQSLVFSLCASAAVHFLLTFSLLHPPVASSSSVQQL